MYGASYGNTLDINGLNPNTTYYRGFYYHTHNSDFDIVYYIDIKSFTTPEDSYSN